MIGFFHYAQSSKMREKHLRHMSSKRETKFKVVGVILWRITVEGGLGLSCWASKSGEKVKMKKREKGKEGTKMDVSLVTCLQILLSRAASSLSSSFQLLSMPLLIQIHTRVHTHQDSPPGEKKRLKSSKRGYLIRNQKLKRQLPKWWTPDLLCRCDFDLFLPDSYFISLFSFYILLPVRPT
jgi:hypothetical protein